jgi:hypothetical protein
MQTKQRIVQAEKIQKYILPNIYKYIFYKQFLQPFSKNRKQGEFLRSNETKLFWKLNSKTNVLKG